MSFFEVFFVLEGLFVIVLVLYFVGVLRRLGLFFFKCLIVWMIVFKFWWEVVSDFGDLLFDFDLVFVRFNLSCFFFFLCWFVVFFYVLVGILV